MFRSMIAGAITALWVGLPAFAASDYPLLKDSPSSEHYTLVRVNDYWSPVNITYSPAGNFFVLNSRKVSKIDAQGNKVFSLTNSETTHLLPFTYYIATSKGLYNLSRSRPKLERFEQVVNDSKTRTLTVDSFHEIYGQAYAEADIVVYDEPNYEEGIDKYRAYMWIKGGWVLFYLSFDAITLDSDYDLGVTVKEYPAKFNRTLLLRDVQTKTYSAGNSDLAGDNPRLMALLPERKMRYPARGKLKLLHFSKDRVDETYRGVPVVYTGMAEHRLRIGKEDLFFREIALKALRHKLDTQLHWYVVPAPYQDKTQVGFLEFVPISNMTSEGSGGVYALRRK